jgi:hypothetical protein
VHTVNRESDSMKHFNIGILKFCPLILISAPVNVEAAVAASASIERIQSINSSSPLQPIGGKYQREMCVVLSNHGYIVGLLAAA